jgi:hypothetical protein
MASAAGCSFQRFIRLLLDQSIDQIDHVEEAGVPTQVDRAGSQSNGDMGIACSGAAHQNEIVGILGELARTKGFELRLPDHGRAVIEGGKFLVMGDVSC